MKQSGKESLRVKIYNFLENPRGRWAWFVQMIIFSLIIVSVILVGLEFWNRPFFLAYENDFKTANVIILGVFTVEYLLRLITAPQRIKFVIKPLNIIDFLAIAPNYLELILPIFINTTELRVFRLIRLLRFARSLRLLKVLKYDSIVKKVFHYKETILQAITPVLLFFAITKVLIIYLEMRGWWIKDTNLNELFGIIGFALGIILAEKINMTHDKFFFVENALSRMYATLRTLEHIIDRLNKGKGTQAVKTWTVIFIKLLNDPKSDNYLIQQANEALYKKIALVESKPADVHNYFLQLIEDAEFCLSKKSHLTPKAYDTLLHQATLLYLVLIAIFIPGFTGFISVIVAAYVLYGMYYLTQDMDTIIKGEYNLINVRTTLLEHLVED